MKSTHRIGNAIAVFALLTAHMAPAAFIIEANDLSGRLGEGNFTYTGAGGTTASYTTASPGALPAVSNDVPATFFTLRHAFGGNGTADEYTFTYSPLSDGDNTVFAENTLFNLPQGLRSSGLSGGDAGTYHVYRIHPQTSNVSGGNTTYKVSVNGSLVFTQVIDQNASDLSTGENIGRWELLGSVDLSSNTDTVTVSMTPDTSSYVSMRASGIMFEYAAPTNVVIDAEGGTVRPKIIEVTDTVGTIQWQASANGGTWSNLDGATNATLDVSALYTNTPWFRVEVSGTTNAAYSTMIRVMTLSDGTVIYVQ
jgi:hypothetical protein